MVRSVLCLNLTQVSQHSSCNWSGDIPYTQLLMSILSTINVKETRILFQEFMRLTSNCFLHLAFEYCALRVIQVQAHHQTSFRLSCINNFLWQSSMLWFIGELHVFECIYLQITLMRKSSTVIPISQIWNRSTGRKNNLLNNCVLGGARTPKSKPTFHFRDSFLLYWNPRSFHNHMSWGKVWSVIKIPLKTQEFGFL